MRSVDVGVGHDNDATVTKLRHVEPAFLLFAVAGAIFFARFADASANRRDHRLDLGVLEKLIFAGFLDVDQLAADRQDRLVTPVAPLFGRTAG